MRRDRWEELGIKVPTILLPRQGVAMEKWSVIACDQFSAERAFWQETASLVKEDPSTLRMILPECYLEDLDRQERMTAINKTMRRYAKEFLSPLPPGFVYLDRQTPYVDSRKGLVLAIDLEHYDFAPGKNVLIRPTEATVLDRLPPRIAIREEASLDLPHILLLIDDPKGTVIERLEESKERLPLLYDFPLLQGGGHIIGRQVSDPDLLAALFEAIADLQREDDLLFVVGDGNHSLSAAKIIWERLKVSENLVDHPARYALVEVVNIHSSGLSFEPIHRVLFGIDASVFLSRFERNPSLQITYIDDAREWHKAINAPGPLHKVGFLSSERRGIFFIEASRYSFATQAFQELLDGYLRDYGPVKIDYIHGEESLLSLSACSENMGFLFPDMSKDGFFDLILKEGALPRKTFSIGQALEKRYYLECRSLLATAP